MFKSLLPWKHSKTKVPATEETMEDESVLLPQQQQQLTPCRICERTFLPISLKKHLPICEKNSTKKRKIFNSLKQRVEGTDLEQFHQKSYLKDNSSGTKISNNNNNKENKRHSRWQEDHLELVNAIRTAKKDTSKIMSAKTKQQQQRNPTILIKTNERCPFCERQFGPKAFDRHVEWCKEHIQRTTVQKSPANVQLAKERLEARIKYKAPLLIKSKRTLVREKYAITNRNEPKSITSVNQLNNKNSNFCQQKPSSKSITNVNNNNNNNKEIKTLFLKNDNVSETTPNNTRGWKLMKIKSNSLKLNTPLINEDNDELIVNQLIVRNDNNNKVKKLVTWRDIMLIDNNNNLATSTDNNNKPESKDACDLILLQRQESKIPKISIKKVCNNSLINKVDDNIELITDVNNGDNNNLILDAINEELIINDIQENVDGILFDDNYGENIYTDDNNIHNNSLTDSLKLLHLNENVSIKSKVLELKDDNEIDDNANDNINYDNNQNNLLVINVESLYLNEAFQILPSTSVTAIKKLSSTLSLSTKSTITIDSDSDDNNQNLELTYLKKDKILTPSLITQKNLSTIKSKASELDNDKGIDKTNNLVDNNTDIENDNFNNSLFKNLKLSNVYEDDNFSLAIEKLSSAYSLSVQSTVSELNDHKVIDRNNINTDKNINFDDNNHNLSTNNFKLLYFNEDKNSQSSLTTIKNLSSIYSLPAKSTVSELKNLKEINKTSNLIDNNTDTDDDNSFINSLELVHLNEHESLTTPKKLSSSTRSLSIKSTISKLNNDKNNENEEINNTYHNYSVDDNININDNQDDNCLVNEEIISIYQNNIFDNSNECLLINDNELERHKILEIAFDNYIKDYHQNDLISNSDDEIPKKRQRLSISPLNNDNLLENKSKINDGNNIINEYSLVIMKSSNNNYLNRPLSAVSNYTDNNVSPRLVILLNKILKSSTVDDNCLLSSSSNNNNNLINLTTNDCKKLIYLGAKKIKKYSTNYNFNKIDDNYNNGDNDNNIKKDHKLVEENFENHIITNTLLLRKQLTNTNKRNNLKRIIKKIDNVYMDYQNTKLKLRSSSESVYDPIKIAERQLKELLECDDFIGLNVNDNNNKNNKRRPSTTTTTNSNNKLNEPATLKKTIKSADSSLNKKRTSIIDPPTDFQDHQLIGDDFEMIEELLNRSFIINDEDDNNITINDNNHDIISLNELLKDEKKYFDDLSTIDPRLINKNDNLLIPNHFKIENNNCLNVDDNNLDHYSVQCDNKIESFQTSTPISSSLVPSIKKQQLSNKNKKITNKSISSSSTNKNMKNNNSNHNSSNKEMKKKKNLDIAVKGAKKLLDSNKATISSMSSASMKVSEELKNNFEIDVFDGQKQHLIEPIRLENLFTVDDDMYEEYKMYEEMYLKEKEQKSKTKKQKHISKDYGIPTTNGDFDENIRNVTNNNNNNKICDDSAYGSLNRNAFVSQKTSIKLEPLIQKESVYSISSCSSSEDNGGQLSSPILLTDTQISKFCHECGNKYPVETAKFCVMCGVKRLVL